MESTITPNFCWLNLPVDASAIVAFIALIFSGFTFYYQRKHSERAVQPVIVFFNTGINVADGIDKWAFKNVGKEPALNVVLSYKQIERMDWIKDDNWPIGLPVIANNDKPIILMDIKEPDSLRAEYEDTKGNILTTTISANKNSIERICKVKRKFKSVSKQQWQFHLHEKGMPEGYVGISTKLKLFP